LNAANVTAAGALSALSTGDTITITTATPLDVTGFATLDRTKSNGSLANNE
jgi:hypothetical protein